MACNDVSGTIQCWVTRPSRNSPPFIRVACRSTCSIPAQGISQAAFNYVKQDTFWTLTQQLDNIGGSISGGLFGFGLPAGEITGALSAEMRWRTYDMKTNALPTDFVNCTGLRLCTQNGGAAPSLYTQNVNAPVSVNDNVWETALELNVPLLKDVPLAQDLSADIAGRYTNYSISGEAETWKIGVNDRINETIRLRGTMSFDIRAPNLNDLFQPARHLLDRLQRPVDHRQQQHPAGHQGQCRPDAGSRPYLYVGHGADAGFHSRLHHLAGLLPDPYDQCDHQHQLPEHDGPEALHHQRADATIRPIARWPSGRSRLASPAIPRRRTIPTQILSSPLNSAKIQMEGWNFEVGLQLRLGRCVERHTGFGDLAASGDLSAGAGDPEPARHALLSGRLSPRPA